MTARHLADGAWAERHACRYLERQGLELVESNYSTRAGEIDLIMRDDAMLVFVEVRLRRSVEFGHPAESIDHGKRRRVRRAAEHYLTVRRGRNWPVCRFDVVTIVGDRDRQTTEWFPDAFN